MPYSHSAYKFIFGPVASRRFGPSLGVDVSPQKKCCNFDCLYCELAAAKAVRTIADPAPASEILDELKTALKEFANTSVITITANGEPTLYPYLDELIDGANELKTTQKTLILSNGSGVLDERLWPVLKKFDIVKFSLDSVNERVFRRIDRNIDAIDLGVLVQKMAGFRADFAGELVLETLILDGVNDDEEGMRAINEALKIIRPTRIDLSTLDRPPAHAAKAINIGRLGELSRLITAAPVFVAMGHALERRLDLDKNELLNLIKLRPQSEFDVQNNFTAPTINRLNELLNDGKIAKSSHAGVVFYRVGG